MPELKELITQFGQGQEANYKAYRSLFELVTRATAEGSEAQRAEVASGLAAELNAKTEVKKDEHKPTHSTPVRVQIARLLGYVAREEDLSALAEALKDLEVREAARLALDRVSSEAAVAILIAASEDIGPTFRVGVINSLGKRNKSGAAFNFLRGVAADDTDEEVRIAAVEGLSQFSDPAADENIAKACTQGAPACRTRAQKARIRLAENLKIAGRTDEASNIYKAIMNSDADSPQKKAAELGMGKSA